MKNVPNATSENSQMNRSNSRIYSYVGAIFLIVGFVSLRFTFHEGVYFFPVAMIVFGFILLIVAAVKSKIKGERKS